MSIDLCIGAAVKSGEITKAEAEYLKTRFKAYRKQHAAGSEADADRQAQASFAAEMEAAAKEKKRSLLLRAKAVKRLNHDIDAYRTASGRKDRGEGTVQQLENLSNGGFTASSVEGRRLSILGMAHARMTDLVMAFERTKLTGQTPNRAQLDNIVRETMGMKTGDETAGGLAKAWTDTAEWLRVRFNKAGGNIGKIENWGLPQIHNPAALLRMGKEGWKARIASMLDTARMKDAEGTPILPEDLDAALDDVWESIVTQGWNKQEPQHRPFGIGPVGKQHADPRFLIFKDADSWLSYQKEFGQGNPFAAMMQHVSVMARDIAAIEILGPNPGAMIEYLKQGIMKDGMKQVAKGSPGAKRKAEKKINLVENMWNEMRGSMSVPVDSLAANIGAGSRNWITASVLGSAVIPSIVTDPMFSTIARKYAGIPAARAIYSTMSSFGKQTREQAVRSGLILDSAMHAFGQQARYAGLINGPQWTRWLADRTIALSGLSAWTQAARHGFGLDFMGAMADHADTAFEQLPDAFKRTLTSYGLNDKWDAIRASKRWEPEEGAQFIRPNEIAEKDETLAERVLEMILTETQYAVPTTTVRGRAGLINNTKPGSIWGEVARSASMFKSFPVSMMVLHGARAWRLAGQSKASGAAYAGAVLTTATLGGMLAIWLKDIVSGRDPRPIGDTPSEMAKFGGAALLQGGGLGVFGDFFFADVNRFGGGWTQTLTGPMVEKASNAWNLTGGNLIQLATGQDTRFAEEARKFVASNTPGSSLWYLKLGWQRVLMDQLQYMTDPKANSSFKRRQTSQMETYGNSYWWKPGQIAPDRAPQFGMR